VNPSGAVGDASIATAEKGKTIAEANVAGMIEVLREIEAMPLPGARWD